MLCLFRSYNCTQFVGILQELGTYLPQVRLKRYMYISKYISIYITMKTSCTTLTQLHKAYGSLKGLIMDRCVLLTSTPSCVVSPRGDHSGCALVIAQCGKTTREGVDVNNSHLSMINTDNNMMPVISVHTNQYSAYQKQINAWIENNRRRRCHVTM